MGRDGAQCSIYTVTGNPIKLGLSAVSGIHCRGHRCQMEVFTPGPSSTARVLVEGPGMKTNGV